MEEKLTNLFVHHPIDNPTDSRGDKQFLDYDANGNITHIEREVNNPYMPMDSARESVRKFVWDEEDRLMGVDLRPESPRNQPHIAAYTYDAGGERGIRYVPRQMEGEYSGRTAGYTQDMNIMLYPNALITVRPQELPEDFDPKRIHPEHTFTTYTKHYYIGSERINSKLGTVKDLGILCEQIGGGYDLIDEMNTRVMNAGKRLELLYNDLDKDLRLKHPYLYSREHQIVCNFKSHDSELYDAYWYHPDHLGSSSFITNTTGEISQHMEYLPFGETLVEEHLNSYNSPFKFNAKEFDAETGNYYYGARYYDPKWSTFLTPDPALESYPGISPYAYTLNNPIRYVDPTGMYVEDSKDPPVVVDGGSLNTVHIIANSSGTNLTAIGYSKADFKVRGEIINAGGPTARALVSAENKGLYRPLIDARRPYEGFAEAFAAGAANAGELGEFWMNATAVGVGIPLLATSPIIPGLLSRGGVQAGLAKSGISASVQFAINQQINFVGAFADGFMLPGVGDFVGAGLEVGFNLQTGLYSNTLFGQKSINQVNQEAIIGTMFSTKIQGLDAITPFASPLGRNLYTVPNYFANYSIQNYKK